MREIVAEKKQQKKFHPSTSPFSSCMSTTELRFHHVSTTLFSFNLFAVRHAVSFSLSGDNKKAKCGPGCSWRGCIIAVATHTSPPPPPPRHSVQTNKMFVDVRRGGKKKFCSSMFVVVRRGLPLWQGPVRRCSSTNIDEQNRRTFCSSTNQKCSSAHYA